MENNKPNIWLIDIENTPLLSYTWGRWEQNVIDVKEHSYLLSFAAKQLGGKMIIKGLCDYPGYKKDKNNDRLLIENLWNILDEADIVVWQNGDSFDAKKINARFSYYGIKPPSPYKTVDTKKVAKRYFSFDSNSLDNLGQFLGFGKKEKHDGFETWTGCMNGDKKAWGVMKKYNGQDVLLLEKIYLHFLPWINNHPNIGLYVGKVVCPSCGADRIQSRGVLPGGKMKRVQCGACGRWGRIPLNEKIARLIMNIT